MADNEDHNGDPIPAGDKDTLNGLWNSSLEDNVPFMDCSKAEDTTSGA